MLTMPHQLIQYERCSSRSSNSSCHLHSEQMHGVIVTLDHLLFVQCVVTEALYCPLPGPAMIVLKAFFKFKVYLN